MPTNNYFDCWIFFLLICLLFFCIYQKKKKKLFFWLLVVIRIILSKYSLSHSLSLSPFTKDHLCNTTPLLVPTQALLPLVFSSDIHERFVHEPQPLCSLWLITSRLGLFEECKEMILPSVCQLWENVHVPAQGCEFLRKSLGKKQMMGFYIPCAWRVKSCKKEMVASRPGLVLRSDECGAEWRNGDKRKSMRISKQGVIACKLCG